MSNKKWLGAENKGCYLRLQTGSEPADNFAHALNQRMLNLNRLLKLLQTLNTPVDWRVRIKPNPLLQPKARSTLEEESLKTDFLQRTRHNFWLPHHNRGCEICTCLKEFGYEEYEGHDCEEVYEEQEDWKRELEQSKEHVKPEEKLCT